MWAQWIPWRFVIRAAARQNGFIDPLTLLSKFQNFAQPADVLVPAELLRVGVALHARGLINTQAIQHNLDWVWPYWVEQQFDPMTRAFIPRAFSISQINLTHRNWTAIGIPDCAHYPLVDPRGLVTPLFDGWSLDAWILTDDKRMLIPSRASEASQKLFESIDLSVQTLCETDRLSLESRAKVVGSKFFPWCHMTVKGKADAKGWLVISVRPYNPEGISFIHDIELLEQRKGWLVNQKDRVYFSEPADQYEFSYYRHGDVLDRLPSQEDKSKVYCKVGMATAAAMFRLEADQSREIHIEVPLFKDSTASLSPFSEADHSAGWQASLLGHCEMQVPDERFQFLYDTALKTLILHSPQDVYPGPYTYRRFWFRDAAFILYAMVCAGLSKKVERALDQFSGRQTPGGYFLSQEGEWDSNGEAIWITRKFCEMTRLPPPSHWMKAVDKGALWICRKRLAQTPVSAHAGLFPPGFSAEHLGPNDYYYWDDFWGIAGLKSAAYLEKMYGDPKRASHYEHEAENFLRCVKQSLVQAQTRMKTAAMPAAPYRRLDTGSIGSLVAGYPLQIFSSHDPRIWETLSYLMKTAVFNGGFFHDMTHSGINPYLTLHLAQAFLRAGDRRYFQFVSAVADFASSTGQWPEAIHPHTRGGCMGDGQHVWAAAEWVMMMRNCFVREEEKHHQLILCSGIPAEWLEEGKVMHFGPAPTVYGLIDLTITPEKDQVVVSWTPQWFGAEPHIEVHLAGYRIAHAEGKINQVCLKREGLTCVSL